MVKHASLIDVRANGARRVHKLIREAIERYIGPVWDPVEFKVALQGIAGMWADRDDLDEFYEDLKRREQERMARLWGDRLGPDDDGDAPPTDS